MPKPRNHPLEAGRVSTMALIFSVTVPKVWPGCDHGRVRVTFAVLYCSILSLLCAFLELQLLALMLSSSGFGLRTSARYVVRGRVFSSPSRL